MVDLHSHILYGLDDGAKDRTMAENMIELAAKTGTRQIAATPHVIENNRRPSWESIKKGVAELQQIADERALDLQVYPGAELEMNWELLELFQSGSRDYCLNGTRYLLVELPALSIPDYADDFWYELQIGGIVPVLAHPERNQPLMQTPERLLNWMKTGLLSQINGGSLTGQFGAKVQESAELLLRNRMVHLIGSDGHRAEGRDTNLSKARRRLTELVGEEIAQAICTEHPRNVLADEVLVFEVPDQIDFRIHRKEKSLWKRLFGG